MSQTNSPAAPADEPLNSLTDGLAARVLVSIAIIGIAGWVFGIYYDLFKGPPATSTKSTAKTREIDPVSQLLTTAMSEGAWQIQGLDWGVAVAEVAAEKFSERWTVAPTQSPKISVDIGLSLNLLTSTWKPTVWHSAESTVYEFQRANSRLQLWTDLQDAREHLHTIRIGVHSAQKSLIYEFHPLSREPVTQAAEKSDIWPQGTSQITRLCRRFDSQQRILAELWTFNMPFDEVLLNWGDSGWRPIQSPQMLIPLSNTKIPPSPFTLTLQNGPRRIFVWLKLSSPGQPSLAMLTRLDEIPTTQLP